MGNQKVPHPPAPTVPSNLKIGDWVFLNGSRAGLYSGLIKVQFKGLEGASGFFYALRRERSDVIHFDIPAALSGKYEVLGDYDKDSPIPEDDRSFGITQIS
ncbi:MAG: hypothetical protein ACRES5_35690 [Pseudomonas sp.]